MSMMMFLFFTRRGYLDLRQISALLFLFSGLFNFVLSTCSQISSEHLKFQIGKLRDGYFHPSPPHSKEIPTPKSNVFESFDYFCDDFYFKCRGTLHRPHVFRTTEYFFHVCHDVWVFYPFGIDSRPPPRHGSSGSSGQARSKACWRAASRGCDTFQKNHIVSIENLNKLLTCNQK